MRDEPLAGFLVVVQPLIEQGRAATDRCRGAGETAHGLPFDPATVVEILWANLAQDLIALLSRTLVLELHVACLQGFVSGRDPTERLQRFAQYLSQAAWPR